MTIITYYVKYCDHDVTGLAATYELPDLGLPEVGHEVSDLCEVSELWSLRKSSTNVAKGSERSAPRKAEPQGHGMTLTRCKRATLYRLKDAWLDEAPGVRK